MGVESLVVPHSTLFVWDKTLLPGNHLFITASFQVGKSRHAAGNNFDGAHWNLEEALTPFEVSNCTGDAWFETWVQAPDGIHLDALLRALIDGRIEELHLLIVILGNTLVRALAYQLRKSMCGHSRPATRR